MNLLITGAWSSAREHIAQIEAMGHIVKYLEQEKIELPCTPTWVEGVICNGLFLFHPIENFTSLKFIQLTSAGLDRVNLSYIEQKGITLYNARGVYSIPMAEYALAGVLSLYKHMSHFQDLQRDHAWIKNRELRELFGKRVLILGCGSVGTECARRFKAFGCSVIGLDLIVRKDANFDIIKQISGEDALDDELFKSDVIVLTLPLSDQTRGLIDERRIRMIRDDAILVNISRGAVVDQEALEQRDGCAVLDVFEDEPLNPDSPLWDKPGVIITPHNSFVGNGNANRLTKVIMENLQKINLSCTEGI